VSETAGVGTLRVAVTAERLGGERRDLVVEAGADAPAGDVVGVLASAVGVEPASATAFSPRLGRVLARDEAFADAVQHGDRLIVAAGGTAPPRPPEPEEAAARELLVVGGPQAGRRFRLPDGEHVVGRDPGCTIAIDDRSLSRAHLRLRAAAGAVIVGDAGSRNGTGLEGRRVGETLLARGALVRAGRSLLAVEEPAAPVTAAPAPRRGFVEFNRPMRVAALFEPFARRFAAPPDDSAGRGRMGLLASLPFALVGIALWLITGSVTMLLFVAATPLMILLFFVEERWGGKRGQARRRRKFRQRLAHLKAELDAARSDEIDRRRLGAPSPAHLLARARERLESLWERRRDDEDFLALRVGSADLPAEGAVELDTGGSEALREEAERLLGAYATVPAVPVTAPLAEVGALGLCGPPERVAALARGLVLQAATLHSPRDLVVAAGLDEDAVADWSWLKWLPHVASETTPLETHLAAGRIDVRQLAEEVQRVRNERRAEAQTLVSSARPLWTPFVLLVVDEPAAPERPLVADLLTDAASYGIGVLWLGRDRRDLPGECGAVVELDDRGGKLTHRDGRSVEDVLVDELDHGLAEEWALALAPLRDVTAKPAGGGIPDRIGLAELLGAEELDVRWVEARWRSPSPDLGAQIGAAADGPFDVDLRAHGPHALVAGITGAGKSELLQTLIASLAATYPPSRLEFLLIDYKGGLAFKECVELPHATLVTDLDEHLTQRALVSLRAEQRRREALLREADAKDLPELERRDPRRAPPNLVIVIDEFAGLVEELPEFIEGVVDVARRGRALGVHLILATQRPGGVVSQQIRANTNLRIALRVNEPGESTDVIGVVDAARISRNRPGRAYALTGHGDRELTEFQAAYSGDVSTVEGGPRDPVAWELAFGGNGRLPTGVVRAAVTSVTDLQRIVRASREAAERMGLETPPPPWLPPLEPIVPLAGLPDADGDGADPRAVAVVGLLDEPERQRQRPFAVDLERDGSLLVFGTSGSGKTSLLRTLAVSLARRSSPEELLVYGLDFATRALTPLEALPHCGGVIAADDEERVERLLAQLRATLDRRKALFAERGIFTLAELAAAGDGAGRPPRILVLLDGYGGFSDAFFNVRGGELIDAFARLVADGRPLGVHFAITSDRRGAVPNALAAIIPTKIVLRMAEEDEFVALGVSAKTVRGATLPPGRGFVGGHELQCAIVGDDPSAEGQVQALDEAGAELRALHGEAHAPEVRLLPLVVAQADLPPPERPLEAVVGIANTTLEPVSIGLTERHFLVVGPYRSGRTSALRIVAESLRQATPGAELRLLSPRRNWLSEPGLWKSVAIGVEACEAEVERLAELVQAGRDKEADEPIVVLLDDGDELADSLAAQSLATIVRRGRDLGVRLVAAVERQVVLSTFSPWLVELRKEKYGLLLEPDLMVDGDILGVVLPRRTNRLFPPGRGFLVDRGTFELVQIAQPDDAGAPPS
jgi:DNA segregation ATPase FtsK/SpoIIIE, S-DNA-T family